MIFSISAISNDTIGTYSQYSFGPKDINRLRKKWTNQRPELFAIFCRSNDFGIKMTAKMSIITTKASTKKVK